MLFALHGNRLRWLLLLLLLWCRTTARRQVQSGRWRQKQESEGFHCPKALVRVRCGAGDGDGDVNGSGDASLTLYPAVIRNFLHNTCCNVIFYSNFWPKKRTKKQPTLRETTHKCCIQLYIFYANRLTKENRCINLRTGLLFAHSHVLYVKC